MHKYNLNVIVLCFVSCTFFICNVWAVQDCGLTIPQEVRLKKLNCGVGYTRYEEEFNDPAVNKDKVLFEQLFKLHVAKFSNISGSIIKFKKKSKDIYRSAILSENIALLSELVKQRSVKSIVVLTSSKIFNITPWIDKERLIFSTLGGAQFIQILDFDSHFDMHDNSEVRRAYNKVASIIKLIAKADGNVLIHCLGGEHKTEIVFEVMQKCLNKTSMDNITQRYKCHTGCINKTDRGDFRQNNVDFIRNFPCSLIDDL